MYRNDQCHYSVSHYAQCCGAMGEPEKASAFLSVGMFERKCESEKVGLTKKHNQTSNS